MRSARSPKKRRDPLGSPASCTSRHGDAATSMTSFPHRAHTIVRPHRRSACSGTCSDQTVSRHAVRALRAVPGALPSVVLPFEAQAARLCTASALHSGSDRRPRWLQWHVNGGSLPGSRSQGNPKAALNRSCPRSSNGITRRRRRPRRKSSVWARAHSKNMEAFELWVPGHGKTSKRGTPRKASSNLRSVVSRSPHEEPCPCFGSSVPFVACIILPRRD